MRILRSTILSFIFLFLCGSSSFALIVRGGDFTFTVSGFNVSFHLKLYEDPGALTPDSLDITYGDGNTGYLIKTSTVVASNGVKIHDFEIVHAYPGTGSYNVYVCDIPNRSNGISNIMNSGSVQFSIGASFTLSSFITYSSSPLFNNDHFQKTISGDTVTHQTATYDPDGDSLSFELIPCFGGGVGDGTCGSLIFGSEYVYPSNMGGAENLDTVGTLRYYWPSGSAKFSFAIRVSKWRNGNLLCTVMRDILIENYWVGISEPYPNFTFLNVFPNPATSKVSISFNSEKFLTNGEISFYSVDGRLVFKTDLKIAEGHNITSIDLASIPQGAYFIVISSGDFAVRSRFLVIGC